MINGIKIGSVKVINLHEIHPTDKTYVENLFGYLKNKKNLISVEELYRFMNGEIELKSNSYLLTVDDGHESFFNIVYPLVIKLKIPIALFVSPKIISEESNYWFQEIEGCDQAGLRNIISEIISVPITFLDSLWIHSIFKALSSLETQKVLNEYKERYQNHKKRYVNVTKGQLKTMHQSGLVTIGAHTMTHPILRNESDESSIYEIEESVMGLSKLLNSRIDYFAYPNGIPNLDYGKREIDILREVGIKMAFSTNFSTVSRSDNLFEIPRGEISFGRFDFRPKLMLWDKWRKLNDLRMGTRMIDDRIKLLRQRESIATNSSKIWNQNQK